MRKSDMDQLSLPYSQDVAGEDQFSKALGVHVPHAAQLEAVILRDLDPTTFGIGWWSGYTLFGDKRRILIGDYLATAAASIQTNLDEAQLHLLELVDSWDQQGARMADAIVADSQHGFRVRHPRQASAADGLADAMSTLHLTGFFRAINSAIDCVGAAIVGVAALELDIVKTDFDKAKTNLVSKAKAPDDPRQSLNAALDALIAAAGPAGWLTWTTKFRHMLLHRARRLQDGSMKQRLPALLGPDGRVVVRADAVPHVPTEPGRSDIDAFRDPGLDRYLGEHASETVHGVLTSTVFLIDGAARELCNLWESRKKTPQLLEQPSKQWPRTDIPDPIGFVGYAPERSKATIASANETLIKRLTCAAIGDADRHRWQSFT